MTAKRNDDIAMDDREGAHDYLWDRSAPVDPAADAMERDLEGVGLKRRTLREADDVRVVVGGRVRVRRAGWLAAAAVAVLSTTVWLALRTPESGWVVQVTEGSPRIGSVALESNAPIRPGRWITTDGVSRATIARTGLGSVTLDPNGRVRVLRSSGLEQRLELTSGRISASIYAPPRLFIVQTPAATATDMGCAYTLEVDKTGAGELRVSAGRVDLTGPALKGSASEVRVMAGAACRIIPGLGPGTPYFLDTNARLIEAVALFDQAAGDEERARLAEPILEAATGRDALTVWHVAMRLGDEPRRVAAARLLELVPDLNGAAPPRGEVTDEVLRSWWGGLGLAW